MNASTKPQRMRGRDRRAIRKAEARFAEQLERYGTPPPLPDLFPETPPPVAPAPVAPSPAAAVSTAAMRTSDGRGHGDGVRRARAMVDGALKDGCSVVALSAAGVARKRLPYPAGGAHAIYLTPEEYRWLQRALDGLVPSSFVRRAVLAAAGLPPPRRLKHRPPRRTPSERVVFYHLSRVERAGVDGARRDRDLTAWVRDVVRAAVGMRRSNWSPCADVVVRKGFRRWDVADVLRALPGRTAETVTARAKHLGCSTALGDERLSLKAAAKRAGYHDRTLRRMLTEAGTPPLAMVGTKPGEVRRRLVVRWDDVVRVVRENCRRTA